MQYELLRKLDHVSNMIAHSPRGLTMDVDGTISEIAVSPDKAYVSESMRQYLQTLTKYFDLVAAVSGRAAANVRSMVGLDELVYVGNHGLEWARDGEMWLLPGVKQYVGTIARAVDEIGSQLMPDAITIENKGATAAIHFRQAKETAVARNAVFEAIRNSPSTQALRIIEGKMVLELRPPLEANKGLALARLARNYRLKSIIYLGDDITDVDAFTLLRKLRTDRGVNSLAVAVLGPETPDRVIAHADATLNGTSEVEHFLSWLAQESARLGGAK